MFLFRLNLLGISHPMPLSSIHSRGICYTYVGVLEIYLINTFLTRLYTLFNYTGPAAGVPPLNADAAAEARSPKPVRPD